MMSMHLSYAWAAIAGLMLAAQAPSLAGTITGASLPVGPHVLSPEPSDINFGCFADYRIDVTGLGPADLVVDVSPSSSVKDYAVIAAQLGNFWTQPITGIQLILGTGSVDPGAGTDSFQPFSSGGLDFDWESGAPAGDFPPPAASAAGSYDLDHQPYVLAWTNDETKVNNLLEMQYSLDVPDGLSTFTIRHVPMPEPTSIAIAGLAGLIVLSRRRPAR